MRILMLSRDASGLDPRSSTAARWRLLRDQGVDLMVVISSRQKGGWQEQGITVRASGGRCLFSRLWSVYVSAKESLRMNNVDLITAQDPFELGFLAWRLAHRFEKQFELQDHGGFFDGVAPDEPMWFVRGPLARFLAKRAQSIRTVSPGSYRLLSKFSRARVYVLPIAAESRFADAQWNPEPDHLVSVGRLVSVKRMDAVLRVFCEYAKTRPTARLTIVGDGPARSALAQLATKLRIGSRVAFVGSQDPLPFLERASVFLLLSAHEGWGVAAIEAALVGVPVVMTDTGCGAWLAERNRAQCVPIVERDPKRIVEAILASTRQTIGERKALDVAFPEQTAKEQVECWRACVE